MGETKIGFLMGLHRDRNDLKNNLSLSYSSNKLEFIDRVDIRWLKSLKGGFKKQ